MTHERIETKRASVGRRVEAVPPLRGVGDTIIMLVVEEFHIRRVCTTKQRRETMVLRA